MNNTAWKTWMDGWMDGPSAPASLMYVKSGKLGED